MKPGIILGIERKKLKSTGFFISFLGGGILAGLFPILNTAFRTELFTSQSGHPLAILLDANGQMMTMLGLMLVICASCIMYHVEYQEHALRKMLSLPLAPDSLYWGKAVILTAGVLFLLVAEGGALTFCAGRWFTIEEGFFPLLIKNGAYSLLLMLPTILCMLLISSACRNMWVSIGTGVVLLSMASVLPDGPFLVTLCPFITPFKTLLQTEGEALAYMGAMAAEIVILGAAAFIIVRVRRYTI